MKKSFLSKFVTCFYICMLIAPIILHYKSGISYSDDLDILYKLGYSLIGIGQTLLNIMPLFISFIILVIVNLNISNERNLLLIEIIVNLILIIPPIIRYLPNPI